MIYRMHSDHRNNTTYSLNNDWLLDLDTIKLSSNVLDQTKITFAHHNTEDVDIKIPDIIPSRDSIYFSENAYRLIVKTLNRHGHFFKAYSGNSQGYIFCPSITIKQTISLPTFTNTKNTLIFKGMSEYSSAIFCHRKIKDIINNTQLTGAQFYHEQ